MLPLMAFMTKNTVPGCLQFSHTSSIGHPEYMARNRHGVFASLPTCPATATTTKASFVAQMDIVVFAASQATQYPSSTTDFRWSFSQGIQPRLPVTDNWNQLRFIIGIFQGTHRQRP